MKTSLLTTSTIKSENGQQIVWETHRVTLVRDDIHGFGLAVSGGEDNQHFGDGDPAIAVSDVVPGSPADGKLMMNDRLEEVNGVSLDRASHATAISLLRECGQTASIIFKRKILLSRNEDFDQPFKVTLSKKNKKDDYGVVLGCRYYIKQILSPSLASSDATLREGDTVLKINNISVENMSLLEAKKQMEKNKDKLQLVVLKSGPGGRREASSSLKPLSLDQLDRPATPVLTGAHSEPDLVPPRPPLPVQGLHDYRPPSPTYIAYSDVGMYPRYTDHIRPREPPGPRFVSFKRDRSGLGIRISGGNKTGIFVVEVAKGSSAHQQRLVEGDIIHKVNDTDLKHKTREEAALMLLGLKEHVNLLVQYSRPAYERLMAAGGAGDSIYLRVHFDYTDTEHGEMSFQRGDVFHVSNTLYNGIVGSYEATRLGPNQEEMQKGIIPNKTRAEQLELASRIDRDTTTNSRHSTGASSFFKRKARRAKSLNRDHWDEIMFGSGSLKWRSRGPSNSKFPAYERVILRNVNFLRPVVVFGPLADVVRERLLIRRPDRYEAPQPEGRRDEESRHRSGIVRMGAIRDIMDKRKHCLLDVTPSAIERLLLAQYAPIVVFLKAESKQQVKDLRNRWIPDSTKSSRKLYEQAARLDKHYKHLFTFKVSLTNGDIWVNKVMDGIEKAQRNPVWLSEQQEPDQVPKDDYLFPMSARLSFASSPESDAEQMRGDEAEVASITRRPQRASSDPSLVGEMPYPPHSLAGELPYPPHGMEGAYPSRMEPYGGYPGRGEEYPERGLYPPGADHPDHPSPTGHRTEPTVQYGLPQQPRPDLVQGYPRTLEPYATLGPRGLQYTGPGYPMGPHQRPAYPQRPMERTHKSMGDLYRPQPAYMAYHVTQAKEHPAMTSEPIVHRELDYITQHPANRHDDSKLQEKYQQGKDQEVRGPEVKGHELQGKGYDPYKFTRTRQFGGQSPISSPNPWKASDPRVPPAAAKGFPTNLISRSHPQLTTNNDLMHNTRHHNGHVNNSSYPNMLNGLTNKRTSPDPASNPSDTIREPSSSHIASQPSHGAGQPPQGAGILSQGAGQPPQAMVQPSKAQLEGHQVVATARGVFDHLGGVLESLETGVSVVIPRGAIPIGRQQEIYFKVCQDKNLVPPLDKEKGETLLSPLVMCGPHGLRFLKPVELRLPHCASVDPDGWSFALKSNDEHRPGSWQSLGLSADQGGQAGGQAGDQQGRVGKNSVSVLVDHF